MGIALWGLGKAATERSSVEWVLYLFIPVICWMLNLDQATLGLQMCPCRSNSLWRCNVISGCILMITSYWTSADFIFLAIFISGIVTIITKKLSIYSKFA